MQYKNCQVLWNPIYIYVNIYLHPYNYYYICVYVYRLQNVFLRCPTPRLHCFLSSQWPSFRFLSFMAFLIPSTQFFFILPRALFCFGIHFNAILGNLPSAILWTWPYHVRWFCSISFIIVSSSPICYLNSCISNSFFSWYSRGSPQGIHLCSFDPSLIIFCESPCFGTIQLTAFNQCIINVQFSLLSYVFTPQ